jgi:hypothetical protein
MNYRGELVWLLTFCAASTKSVITFYWVVQWTCGFLHGKVDFKTVPCSTHAALELSGYVGLNMSEVNIRTDLSELVRTDCPN